MLKDGVRGNGTGGSFDWGFTGSYIASCKNLLTSLTLVRSTGEAIVYCTHMISSHGPSVILHLIARFTQINLPILEVHTHVTVQSYSPMPDREWPRRRVP